MLLLRITGLSRYIQFILGFLGSHLNHVQDVNWNNHEPSRLATCGIDSWIWLWDIREPTKPTGGIRPKVTPYMGEHQRVRMRTPI